MTVTELAAYLDDYLRVAEVPDYRGAHNGLQVCGGGEARRIALCVDACLSTIRDAASSGADMMIAHHGILWGPTAPVIGPYYERLAALIRADVALYACHLPLDVHEEVGNNHVLCRRLGLRPCGRFAAYEGVPIGVWADTDTTRSSLHRIVNDVLGTAARVIPAGPERVRRLGIVTGGGGDCAPDAAAAGCDTLLTGEGAHHTFFLAEELGLNVLHAGHYATETVGIQALTAHLRERLGLDCVFLDHPTGL